MHLKAIQTRVRKLEAVVDLDPTRRIEEFFRAWDGTGDFPPEKCPLTIAMLDEILHRPNRSVKVGDTPRLFLRTLSDRDLPSIIPCRSARGQPL